MPAPNAAPRRCDFCRATALCVPIEDSGDGGITYACGRCASTGNAPGFYSEPPDELQKRIAAAIAAEPRSTMLDPSCTEVKRAFRLLPGGPVAECPCGCREVWQYMGTWERGGLWCHNFRHRHHPDTGQRRYMNIPAEAGTFTI